MKITDETFTELLQLSRLEEQLNPDAVETLGRLRRQLIVERHARRPEDFTYEVGDEVILPATETRNAIRAEVTEVYPTATPWREGDRLALRDMRYEQSQMLCDSWRVRPTREAMEASF